MSANQTDLYLRFTGLKAKQPGLQTWISIGGWTFNDPGPTQKTFSNIAASSSAQSAFFGSLLVFLKKYNFDGVDLDWYDYIPDDLYSIAETNSELGSIQPQMTVAVSQLTSRTLFRF